MQTIAVVNQKGGCGKTTTAVNLAAALAEQRQRVLLVDLDPQAHATIGLGHDPDALERTVYDAVTAQDTALADVLLATRREGLHLAPGSIMLAGAEIVLSQRPCKEQILGEQLQAVADRFDLCVIDCAPSFGVLTIGALVGCTDVVVPVQAQYYSLEGLRRVLETVRLIRNRSQSPCAGRVRILLTLVERGTKLSKQIQVQIREIFGPLVFDTVIHRNVRLSEAPSAGESVLTYAPQSRGAAEYRAVAAEILGGVPCVQPARGRSARRGMQKHVATMFEGVWPAHGNGSNGEDQSASHEPDESPASRDAAFISTT